MDKTAKFKILWAEDTQTQFEDCSGTLGNFLKENGIEAQFTNAINGAEIFGFLTANSYDALILDLDMPRFGGLAVLPEIAKRYPGIPVIVVSEHTQDRNILQELQQALASGMLHSFHRVEPRDGYCKAVLNALTKKSPVMLHLSDLHFGKFHAFKNVSAEELFESCLDNVLHEATPNLLIISGDLTSVGDESEFSKAREFILRICHRLKLSLDQTVIVPGNHDIDRNTSGEDKRFSNYIDFLIGLYHDLPNPSTAYARYPDLFDSRRGILLPDARIRGGNSLCNVSVFDMIRTVAIGLNSVVADDAELSLGRVSPHQLLSASRHLAGLNAPQSNYFRIAVFHHNLFVVPSFRGDGEPERVVRNPSLLLHHLIDNRVKLILHGHSHYSIVHEYRPRFLDADSGFSARTHVIATGTLGASDRETSQPYAAATLVSCNTDQSGLVSGAAIIPFRLMDKMLKWKRGEIVPIQLQ